MDFRCLLIFWMTLPFTVSQTGAPYPTVYRIRGQSIELSSGITTGPGVNEFLWRHLTSDTRTRLADYLRGKVKYYGTEEFKRRMTLHPRNFSLKIDDLQKNNTGVYEVVVTANSGVEISDRICLEVYEIVSGTYVTVEYTSMSCITTLTCSVISGDPTKFRWWKEQEAVVDDSTHHLREGGAKVEVNHTAELEGVVYHCKASNPVSNGTALIQLRDFCRQITPGGSNTVYKVVVVLLIVTVVILIGTFVTVKKDSVFPYCPRMGKRSNGAEEVRPEGL